MARRSSTQITSELAKKIIKKLKGKKSGDGKKSGHKYFDIFDLEGQFLVTTSLRHGSKKYHGHDHFMGDLRVNAHNLKELAKCPLSREDWIKAFRAA